MRYAAFLSYSHADARWANWLLRKLETYRVPKRLVGTMGAHGRIGPRLGKVFRDRDELPTAGDLGETIRAALADSDALVVICSPASAQSRWVGAEVDAFRTLGRDDRIACFIVDGEPGDNASPRSCFPSSIIAPGPNGEPREPLAADARKQGDGRVHAFLKLVAGLLGVSYDDLAQREAQRRHRRMAAIAIAAVFGMAVAFGLAATAWVARNDAQRRQAQAEDILGFMLGDLRDKLTKVGRLDLMSAVDDKATGYFATLKPRDLTDAALEEQARSLTGIGEVRLSEGKHDAALAAFREALDRSSALYDRAPDNGQRLYDRAQAEYWIGFVGLQQGDYDTAGHWLTRYRDSAILLAALDPGNFEWQMEVAYGHHNLAVMDQRRGRFAEAERSIRKEVALFRGWIRQHPDDLQLRFDAADAISWLGTLAMEQGQLAEAEKYFVEKVELMQRNVSDEPDNVKWKQNMAGALAWITELQVQRGRLDAARQSLAAGMALDSELVKLDPENNGWRASLARWHLWQAELDAASDPVRAVAVAADAESQFSEALAAEPKSQRVMLWLVRAQLLRAQLDLAGGNATSARQRLSDARALIEPAWQGEQNENLRIWLANTRLLQGDVAAHQGNRAAAVAAWAQARQLLLSDANPDVTFARLDPLVRALRSLGQDLDAAPYLQRMAVAGYKPLRPLPPPAAVANR